MSTYPLGGVGVAGTTLTVDMLTRTPTRIENTIRDMVAANEGYFAEELLRTPGMTVQGGAVLYQETVDGGSHYLDPDQSLAPRAPGAESPLVGIPEDEWKVARVESLAGKFEVTDEAKRRNLTDPVLKAMRRIANTLAQSIQDTAVDAAVSFLTAHSRTVTGVAWDATFTGGVTNVDPATLPQRDFALVASTFASDKTGVKPSVVVLHPGDAFYLDVIYGDKLPAMLDRYGLRLRMSPRMTEGTALFASEGDLGFLAFEKPLSVESGRGAPGTWKDVHAVEATPVVVVNDATAGLLVTNISS